MSEWEQLFDSKTRSEGYDLYLMGKAKKLAEDVNGYEARVRGDRNYTVHMFVKLDGEIGFSCSCDKGERGVACEHAAAAFYLLDEKVGVSWGFYGIEEEEDYDPYEEDYDPYEEDYGFIDDPYDDYDYVEDNEFLSDLSKASYHPEPAGSSLPQEAVRDAQPKTEKSVMNADPKEARLNQVLPDLAALKSKIRAEFMDETDQTDEAETVQGYFQYEKFRENLNISGVTLKKAKDLLGKQCINGFTTQFGYVDGSYQNNFICKAEADCSNPGDFRFGAIPIMLIADRKRIVSVHCGNWGCNCTYSDVTPYLELCPHVTALILKTEEFLKKNNQGDSSNFQGVRLVKELLSKKQPGMLKSKNNPEAEPVQLVPVAELDQQNHLSVSFKTGTAKLYKVKDLDEFVKVVKDRGEMKFGKNTFLSFSPECFLEEGAEWFRFIDNFLQEDNERKVRRNLNRSFGYYYETEKKIGGSIPLYGVLLDRFMNLIQGKETEFSISEGRKKTKQNLTLKEGNLALRLDLHKITDPDDGSFLGVELTGVSPSPIDGFEASYYIDGESIYRIDKNEKQKIAPLLNVAVDGKIEVRIGKNKLADFYHKALPVIKEMAEVTESDREEIAPYIPQKPEFHVFLDVDSESVYCWVDVWYGNRAHALADLLFFDNEYGVKAEPYWDLQAEDQILSLVSPFFNKCETTTKVFCTERQDESLFDFLQYGIPELFEFCEIHMTDAFRRLKVRDQSHFEMDVSVESDLMNLKLTSNDLSPKELFAIFQSYHQKKRFVRLKNGDFFRIEQNETIEQIAGIMDSLHLSAKELIEGKMHIPAFRALYLDKMLEQHEEIYAERDSRFSNIIKSFKTVSDADYAFPGELKSVLRGYQRDGYRWLRTLNEYHFGGILADEMGLGKTLQAIAVLLAEKEEHADGKGDPSIVICPASLVYNWEEELHRFAPALTVSVIAGTKSEREQKLSRSREADVIVTSYDLLKRDIPLYEDLRFHYEIIDEAQYIKNKGTASAKAVKILKSRTRLALTGTPIENRLGELWSIFDYLMPGFLYEHSRFQKEFEIPITKKQDEEASARLKKMTAPFILRRLKKDVLKDLPEKLEEIRYAAMEKEQRDLYNAQVARMSKSLRMQNEEEFKKNKIQILAELTKIRQICCDPSLLFDDYYGSSAKRQACIELIGNALAGEHKILLFSQFTSMLELLEEDLNQEGISYYKITGATPKDKRIQMVRQFNEDETQVFLISLKAGGTGLNLTGADVVIHYDPWWNLAAQNQATDRAHRIGQKNVVTVYKLIVKGTIEEKIVEMQERKKQLAEDILNHEAVQDAVIRREDLLSLLG